MRTTLASLLAGALLATAAGADVVQLTDGTTVPGRLLAVVLESQGGGLRALEGDQVTALGKGDAPPVADGWGSRPGTVPGGPAIPPPPPPPGPNEKIIEIVLTYEAPTAGPQPPSALGETDPGDFAEVFAYRLEDVKNRGAWTRIGSATRTENAKFCLLSEKDELDMLRAMIANPAETRETIMQKHADAMKFVHRMTYYLRTPWPMADGIWCVYINFSSLKRHRVWNGLRFSPGQVVRLEYKWSNHYSFGQ